MRNLVTALAIFFPALLLLSGSEAATFAAPIGPAPAIEASQDIESVLYRCRYVQHCTPAGCELRKICPVGCPDRLSCYPLYGAYGPWGGRSYWGSYGAPYFYYR